MKTLILDADVECYHIANANTAETDWGDGVVTTSTNETWEQQLHDRIAGYCETLGCDTVFVALSDLEGNWRKDVLETYKSSRKDKERPLLWYEVRSHLIDAWDATLLHRLEGDDVCGLAATNNWWFEGDRVVCSIDKDLHTIPGYHWSPGKGHLKPIWVPPQRAAYCLAWQTLAGDQVDDYAGCPGVGPVAAHEALESVSLRGKYYGPKLWNAVVEVYEENGLDEGDALIQASVARILQGDDYNPETLEVQLWNPK